MRHFSTLRLLTLFFFSFATPTYGDSLSIEEAIKSKFSLFVEGEKINATITSSRKEKLSSGDTVIFREGILRRDGVKNSPPELPFDNVISLTILKKAEVVKRVTGGAKRVKFSTYKIFGRVVLGGKDYSLIQENNKDLKVKDTSPKLAVGEEMKDSTEKEIAEEEFLNTPPVAKLEGRLPISPNESRTIDVLFVASDPGLVEAGGIASLQLQALSALNEANQVLANSGISHRFRFIGVERLFWDDPKDSSVTFPWSIERYKFLRKSLDADSVVTIISNEVLFRRQQPSAGPDDDYGCGVLNFESSWKAGEQNYPVNQGPEYLGSVLTSFPCLRQKFQLTRHLAATLGLYFDEVTVRRFLRDSYFKIPSFIQSFARAYVFRGKSGKRFATVMAKPRSDVTTIPYFSNPNLQFDGVPLGKEREANNALIFNLNAPYVSLRRVGGFSAYPILRPFVFTDLNLPAYPPGWQLTQTASGRDDGDSILMWRNFNSGDLNIRKYDTGPSARFDEGFRTEVNPGTQWLPKAFFAQNSDRYVFFSKCDPTQKNLWNNLNLILQRNLPSGRNILWGVESYASGFPDFSYKIRLSRELPALPNPDWEIEGMDQLSGESPQSVIWRHRPTGRVDFWNLSCDRTFGSSVSLGNIAPEPWRVKAVVDLNNDSFKDIILWNRVTGGVTIHLMKGSRGMVQTLSIGTVLDNTWEMIGTWGSIFTPQVIYRNINTGQGRIWKPTVNR
jgi:hypothetical protein